MGKVTLIDPSTNEARIFDDRRDADELAQAYARGWAPESARARASRTISARVDEDHSGLVDKGFAAVAAGARGITAGGSDALASALFGEDAEYDLRVTREANPGTSTAFEIGGSFLGPGAALGARVARVGGELGAAGRILRGGAAAATEGAVMEAGGGVSDLALSDDPLSVERVAGTLSHRALFGAGVGGVAGGALSGLEVGLGAARRRLTQARDAMARGDGIAEDLAAMDRKGLRKAEADELARIEAERVPQREQLAGDLATYREAAKTDQPWTAVATGNKLDAARARKLAKKAADLEGEALHWEGKAALDTADTSLAETARAARADADAALEAAQAASSAAGATKAPRWMREQGKLAMEADKALDRLLRNPKALAERPQMARAALQQQEHALEQILSKADELRVIHATDTTGRRAAALDSIPGWLERNRAMQGRIAELTALPASERLASITNAVDALGATTKKTLGEQMAAGTAYGLAADLTRMVPVIGPLAAPLVGARVADAISGKLGTQLVAATRAAAERATKAIDAFVTVTKAAQRLAPKTAPVLASKVLEAVRFGPEAPANDQRDRRRGPTLEESYDARAAELGASVMRGPDGRLTVRPEVRRRIGELLSPLAAVARHVADRIESLAVRRLEFVAAKMPRATQIGMTRIRPDEMAIRAWARYVAAAEDPSGIEERLADGTITPEDAEVMRELYPERMAEITRQVVMKLGELRATLPYQRRLALAIFTGAPVDASLDPRILGALQASFVEEPGTAGGTQAPRPQPAFGSVKKPEPTPAQRRAAGV